MYRTEDYQAKIEALEEENISLKNNKNKSIFKSKFVGIPIKVLKVTGSILKIICVLIFLLAFIGLFAGIIVGICKSAGTLIGLIIVACIIMFIFGMKYFIDIFVEG
jgi:ABC-type Na+ efflux pump permease subunit